MAKRRSWWSNAALRQAIALTEGGGVSLLNLFRNGEDGFLFYPMSDLTRLFLLSNGSTGNAAVDTDPVGLDLDNHSWGDGVSLASVLAAATELLVPGSWTMSVVGGTSTATESPAGTLTLVPDGTNASRGDQSFTTVVGKTYRVIATVATSASAIQIGTAAGGTQNGTNTFNVGSNIFYFVATATTTYIRFIKTSAATSVISAISCKLVPGNHAPQATTTKRPLWNANGGKPYLAPDASDDALVTPFLPPAACTLAVACRFPATDATGRVVIGGGSSAGSKRCFIGKNDTSGKAAVGWGSETLVTNSGFGADLGVADHVIILTGDAVTRDLWIDNALVDSRAPTGGPDGTGGGLALACFNNNGVQGQFMGGRLYSALALNRRVTPSEIAIITSQFQRTYQ